MYGERVQMRVARQAERTVKPTPAGEGIAVASSLLKARFPAISDWVDGTAKHSGPGGSWVFHLAVSQAEGQALASHPSPYKIASTFVANLARSDWHALGRLSPGNEGKQHQHFNVVVSLLAQHISIRARDLAPFRREVASPSDRADSNRLLVRARSGSELRTWRGLPAIEVDPADAVVVHLHAVRVIRHLKKTLRSEAQKAFLDRVEKDPALAHSLGVHGQWGYIAEELGISQGSARQLLSRIRAAIETLGKDDAA